VVLSLFPLLSQADALPAALFVPGGIAEIVFGDGSKAAPKKHWSMPGSAACSA